MKIKPFLLLVLVVVQTACSPAETRPPIQTSASPTQIIPPTAVATSTPVIQKVYLMDLEPNSVSVGYWALGKGEYPGSDSGMTAGKVIQSHGISYPQGLFAHAPSVILYELDGLYTTLVTDILIKDTACGDGAFFSISVDNDEVFHSANITAGEQPSHIELDITSGTLLKLETATGDSNACDWTIWGDPYLLADPVAIAATPNPDVMAGASKQSSMDGMVQLMVPSGKFPMGTLTDGDWIGEDELPQHDVYLDAYWMDKTEITNAQYRTCIQAGACKPPQETRSETRKNYFDDPAYDDYPVIQVDWDQANTYCGWAGRRLPTEAEWEKAARGRLGRIFPWLGEGYGTYFANFGIDDDFPNADTSVVGSVPGGASPYGILDMAGNVYEWTADWYAADYYSQTPVENPTGPDLGIARVIRGGAWSSDWVFLRTASRLYYYPQDYSNDLGFRCAQSN